MSATVPLAGRVQTLQQIITSLLSGKAKLHLLGSSLTITDATTLSNLEGAEATWSGYSAQTLLAWTAAVDSSGPIASTSAFASFTPTGSSGTVDVYGYWMTDQTNAILYMCESFAAGPIAIAVGSPWVPTVQYQLTAEYPA